MLQKHIAASPANAHAQSPGLFSLIVKPRWERVRGSRWERVRGSVEGVTDLTKGKVGTGQGGLKAALGGARGSG